MGAFFVYILKSTFCLILFYLFYRLLLTRDTFHRVNRVGILFMIVLSVIIPFVKFSVEEPVVSQQPLLDLEYLLMMASMIGEGETVVETPLWIRLLLWTYLAGAAFFFLLFLYSCFQLIKIMRRGKAKQRLENGITLITTDENIAPFSWMKWIIISEKDLLEGGEEIIAHEMAHIEARHSLDLLISELGILFHWFNPAMWLFKLELQNIHEYEADEKVIQKGIDAKKYQLLLIKKAVGSQRFTSMANSFNHRSLKKRISMMLKRKSSPWARLKYLFVFPLSTLAVVTFARPEISDELEKISSVKISEIVPVKEINEEKSVIVREEIIPDTLHRSKPVQPQTAIEPEVLPLEEIEAIQENIQSQMEKQQAIMEKEVRQRELTLEKEIKENFPDIENLTPEERATAQGMIDNTRDQIHEMLRENESEMRRIIEESQKKLEKLHNEMPLRMNGLTNTSKLGFTLSDLTPPPLLIVDGVEKEDMEINDIDPDSIRSVTVLKNESAFKSYGEKGKNGVVLITTKRNENR